MGRIRVFLRTLVRYIINLFIYNKEGWYISDKDPMPEAQMFRIKTGKKPYHQRRCVMCGRDFWTYNKGDVCFRIECFFKYNA